MAWSTLALAIVTAVLVGVGYWVGANQIALMKEQSALQKGALAATKTAAEAATVDAKNTSAALEHSKRAERAWIVFEITEFVGQNLLLGFWTDPGRLDTEKPQMLKLGVRGNFRNGGRTPAHVTAGVLLMGAVVEGELPPEPNFGSGWRMPVPEVLLIPSAVAPAELAIQIDGAQLRDLALSARALIVYGFVTYKDVWEEPHDTRFSLLLRLPKTRVGQPVGFVYGGPPAYNRYT